MNAWLATIALSAIVSLGVSTAINFAVFWSEFHDYPWGTRRWWTRASVLWMVALVASFIWSWMA